MIKHIVFTKFENPDENVPEDSALLHALTETIPEIVTLETGRDVLHSARSFDMALIVTFRSLADLAVYDKHPEHEKARAYIKAHRTATATVGTTSRVAALR